MIGAEGGGAYKKVLRGAKLSLETGLPTVLLKRYTKHEHYDVNCPLD